LGSAHYGGRVADETLPLGGGGTSMLETIAVILVVLWLLGFVTPYNPVGGLIHVLLVIAVVVILVRVIQGRRPLG
jgi:hypothetical protein